MYDTVPTDLSDLDIESYDIIAFFSPSGVSSLIEQFPELQSKWYPAGCFWPNNGQSDY